MMLLRGVAAAAVAVVAGEINKRWRRTIRAIVSKKMTGKKRHTQNKGLTLSK
jgi:hypothetical protein